MAISVPGTYLVPSRQAVIVNYTLDLKKPRNKKIKTFHRSFLFFTSVLLVRMAIFYIGFKKPTVKITSAYVSLSFFFQCDYWKIGHLSLLLCFHHAVLLSEIMC